MASKRLAVKLTANFEVNLAAIEAFWIEADPRQSYDRLLDIMLETVIPNLEQFPKMGRYTLFNVGARWKKVAQAEVKVE